MNLLDLMEGRALRDAGMARVIENQDDAWRRGYRTHAAAFLSRAQPGDTFTGEALRLYVAPLIGQPSHHNAWGAMAASHIRQWLKAGQIEMTGFERAKSAQAHARQYPLYSVR